MLLKKEIPVTAILEPEVEKVELKNAQWHLRSLINTRKITLSVHAFPLRINRISHFIV